MGSKPLPLVPLLLLGCLACTGSSPSVAGAAKCGNGRLEPGELCDDGDSNSDDRSGACRSDCTEARCGDGVVDPGEECDEGEGNDDFSPGACSTACLQFACGNGRLEFGEACDDGAANSDVQSGGCRTSCVPASCGDGVVDPGEECDDGEANDDTVAVACRTSCRRPYCGDGVVGQGEVCDEGDENSDTAPDACRSSCRPASCGDGARDTGEECDEGERNSNVTPDACRIGCILPRCGDGIVDLGEECDDADLEGDDGCDRICRYRMPAYCDPEVPLVDVREVGVPVELGYEVFSEVEYGSSLAAPISQWCSGEGREVVFAFPVPGEGDLIAEAVILDSYSRTLFLAVRGSCLDTPIECTAGSGSRVPARVVVHDVSPAQGVYYVQVDKDDISEAVYRLRIHVRPHLRTGDPCASDGSLGRCDPIGGDLGCSDPDGDGLGTCVPLREEGEACDPAGERDACRAPLSCRGGSCAASCGDGVKQAWEECDDGNAVGDDNCTSECTGRALSCSDPFDLNLAWDPVAQRAVWTDDTSRSVHRNASCGAGMPPDGVATFVAPEGGLYHFAVAADWGSLGPILSLLGDRCEAAASPLTCGGTDGGIRVELDAGQRVYLVVDAKNRTPAPDDSNPFPGGPFMVALAQEHCGDGIRQGGEECDDGNRDDGDRCRSDCTLPGKDCGVPYPLPPADADGTTRWVGTMGVYEIGNTITCGTQYHREAVGTYIAPSAGRYSFLPRQGIEYLSVRTESCENGLEVGCEVHPAAHLAAAVEADLEAGESAWIRIGGWSGEFEVQVRRLVCGDGVRIPPEECDDGNAIADDGCDTECRVVPVVEIEPNEVRAQAQHVPVGAVVAGSLPPGDRDFFSVDLAADESYSFIPYLGSPGRCDAGNGSAPKVWLHGPGGEVLKSIYDSYCWPLSFLAPVSGRYYLRLDHPGDRNVPAYFLELRAD